jgi:hypothetical protein
LGRPDGIIVKQSKFAARCIRILPAVSIVLYPAAAHAEIGGELLSAFSWILLVPLGVVQLIVAMKMESHLSRSWVGTTALITFVCVVIGATVGLSGEHHHTMGRIVTALAFLPGLPIAVALIRRRLWPLVILTLLPAVIAGLLLDGVGR